MVIITIVTVFSNLKKKVSFKKGLINKFLYKKCIVFIYNRNDG